MLFPFLSDGTKFHVTDGETACLKLSKHVSTNNLYPPYHHNGQKLHNV